MNATAPTSAACDPPPDSGFPCLEACGNPRAGRHSRGCSRRKFAALLLGASAMTGQAQTAKTDAAGKALRFRIGAGFGNASAADISAVLQSAGEALWRHCPKTRWEVPGFYVFHTQDAPVTLYEHHADGSIAIGLSAQGTYWSQFAFQFAHEFCHALAGHSNHWQDQKDWIRKPKANHWLEESLCEVASLFALRAMAETWKVRPPYQNWRDYAGALAGYARDRLETTGKSLPEGFRFLEWMRENEPAMRRNATMREKNNIVARELLPLVERTPSVWEAVTFLQHGKREPDMSLEAKLRDWNACVPRELSGAVRAIGGAFGLWLG
ncbi:MAG: hypothetical protein KA004_07785 [Verrucomicrobiales bacterium]|nr:hypothetical protein [Verrucomicrobiales bacterium]